MNNTRIKVEIESQFGTGKLWFHYGEQTWYMTLPKYYSVTQRDHFIRLNTKTLIKAIDMATKILDGEITPHHWKKEA